ncbi:MAG: phosphate ABC transporter permease PstA, partial [Mucinivorans sp.]
MTNKRKKQSIAFWIFRLMTLTVVGILVWILGFLVIKGAGAISWEFLTSAPSDGMTGGGIFPAIVGTLCLMVGSMIFAFPIGVMSGIYINEYAGNNWLVKFIRVMTNNLSSIPSIVFGLFGMALFVNTLGFGDSILAGSLTLGLLALPIVIRTTEESLRAIPMHYRNASRALGATRLQTIRRVILPMAMPNITTGLILSVGRVSGETAPILF